MLGYLLVSKREWARHRRELRAALRRAIKAEADTVLERENHGILVALERERADARVKAAEDLLTAERKAKDSLIVELTSRFLTKQGAYGLTAAEPPVEKPPHPKRFTHEPSETDLAKLEYYKQCYLQAGRGIEEAEAIWEAEMRGETPVYPYENEIEQ